ncbi:hypothetical protein HRI_003883700 [Hibiscus trionum]|uniref:Uncharacterized protein n=1 Tax=Hibiscus trionum TaxID=183268 RepID=A0A9W7IU89_HIBTR|nr:hypothetical protein HRI_003883700 [Hibiscus trionum]
MQAVKVKANELATLGKPLDAEDLIEKILEGLDDTFQPVIDAVNSRETVITFDELHEKLLNRELTLRNTSPSVSITAYSIQTQRSNHWSHRSSMPSTTQQASRQMRPFLGKCNSSTFCVPPHPWQPQAHIATSSSPSSDPWLLDSGATHHITTNLQNLSLHNPYTSSDEVMIGDGSGVPITHSGSTDRGRSFPRSN